MTHLRLAALLLFLPLAANCSWLRHRREERAQGEAMQQVMQQTAEARQVREATSPAQAPQDQAGITFEATGEGNTVHFTITCHGMPDLYVGPQNLALIPVPEHELIHATDAEKVLCRFYPISLNDGEAAAGELVFLNIPNTVGMRLVYNTNQLEQHLWRTDILAPTSEESTETPVPPQQ